jgi:hypothetical protein
MGTGLPQLGHGFGEVEVSGCTGATSGLRCALGATAATGSGAEIAGGGADACAIGGTTGPAGRGGGFDALPCCVRAYCKPPFSAPPSSGPCAADIGDEGGVRGEKARGAAASRGSSDPHPRQNL